MTILCLHEDMEKGHLPKTQSQCLFRATIGVDYHPSQKNSKKIHFNRGTGQRFIGTDSRVKKAKNLLLFHLRRRAAEYGISKPINHRVRCLLLFGFSPEEFYTRDKETGQLREKLTLGDCTNLAQAVEDTLKDAKIISNDFYCAPIEIDRVCTDKTQVHIELWSNE